MAEGRPRALSREAGLSPVAATLSLFQAQRLLASALDRRLLAAVGLSSSAAEVLVRLGAGPDGSRGIGDLAEDTCFSKSGVSRIMDRLERRRLVTRRISAEDRRHTVMEVTSTGREVMWEALAIMQLAAEEDFASYLSDSDISQLAERLDQVVAGIRGAEVQDPVTGRGSRQPRPVVDTDGGGPLG
ncbi:MAG: MarR family winged helix-turn-helix transcriptional regulator [Candidatus Dormibacteria bacterium]